MTLTCGCDMPMEIYADWLQDQGWDTGELREALDSVLCPYTTAMHEHYGISSDYYYRGCPIWGGCGCSGVEGNGPYANGCGNGLSTKGCGQ